MGPFINKVLGLCYRQLWHLYPRSSSASGSEIDTSSSPPTRGDHIFALVYHALGGKQIPQLQIFIQAGLRMHVISGTSQDIESTDSTDKHISQEQ